MTDMHPMDDVPMPKPIAQIGKFLDDCTDVFSEDQLRSERIAAYELGRNAGLEEAAEQHEIEVQLSGLLEATSRACAEKDLALQACVEALQEVRIIVPEQYETLDSLDAAIQQAQEALK